MCIALSLETKKLIYYFLTYCDCSISKLLSIMEDNLQKRLIVINKSIYYSNDWTQFPKDNICHIAAENGWVDLFKYADENGYLVPNTYALICRSAVLNNH